MSKMKMVLDIVADMRRLANSLESLAKATENDAFDREETQAAPPEQPMTQPCAQPSQKQITIVELRAFVAERSTPENRPKIKAILTKYGVKKLTELKEDQFAAVMEEVAAL